MAEKILIDFTEETKVPVIKEKARQALIEDIIAYLSEKYDGCRKTASNEIGVIVGEAKDEDGFSSDVVVSVKVSTRPWYNKEDCKRPVQKYDLDEEADAYESEVAAKKAPKK